MTKADYNQLHKIRGIGPKRYDIIVSLLQKNNQTLDELFKMSAPAIKEQFTIPISVAKAITKAKTELPPSLAIKTEEDLLAEKNVVILNLNSDNYPQHLKSVLGNKAPQTLYSWGNLDLLNKPAIGFCGSRKATSKGLDVTADTAKQIAELGWVVVSGHAKGVDATAHRVALQNGGGTIIVAPQGILDFRLRRELKQIAKPEQILIISEFPPNAKWHVGYAMKRNKTIIGLSHAMILVEAGLTGGTFNAGKQALELKIPLFVTAYKTPGESAAGNTYFLQKHANALWKSSETGKANISNLRDIVNKRRNNSPSENIYMPPQQIPLKMELVVSKNQQSTQG
jgi:DNA protecting protein DprA